MLRICGRELRRGSFYPLRSGVGGKAAGEKCFKGKRRTGAATDRARVAYAFYIHEIFMVLMTLSRAQQDLNCF